MMFTGVGNDKFVCRVGPFEIHICDRTVLTQLQHSAAENHSQNEQLLSFLRSYRQLDMVPTSYFLHVTNNM